MRALAFAIVVVACVNVVVASGCAHGIMIESTPPGASVLVDGELAGRTPVTIEEKTGRDDVVGVEVQQGDRSARFAYQKSGIATDAVAGAAGLSCAMCVLGGGSLVGLVLAVPAVLVLAAAPELAIGVIIGAYAAYTVGTLLIAYAPYALIIGIGEGARKGPDRIHVDFGPAKPLVTTSPEGMSVPMIGRTRGRSTQRY